MKLYLRQAWRDSRLVDGFKTVDIPKEVEEVSFGGDRVKDFWIPDTFVRNAIDTSSFETAFTKESLFKVNRTGDIWYVHR